VQLGPEAANERHDHRVIKIHRDRDVVAWPAGVHLLLAGIRAGRHFADRRLEIARVGRDQIKVLTRGAIFVTGGTNRHFKEASIRLQHAGIWIAQDGDGAARGDVNGGINAGDVG
jgi:hypothetical protein